MVNCPKCGSYNPTGSKFCSECGSSMDTNSNKSKVRKIKVESHDPKKPIGGISTNENKEKGDNSRKYICIGLIILILVGVFFFGGNNGSVKELQIQEVTYDNSVHVYAIVQLPKDVHRTVCDVRIYNETDELYAWDMDLYGSTYGNSSEDNLVEVSGYLPTKNEYSVMGKGKPTKISFYFRGNYEEKGINIEYKIKDSDILDPSKTNERKF